MAEYVSRKSRKIEIVLEILDKLMPNLEVSLEDGESEGAEEGERSVSYAGGCYTYCQKSELLLYVYSGTCLERPPPQGP